MTVPLILFCMLFVCHSYAIRMCSYITYMSIQFNIILHVIRMSFICHSYVLVCHPHVTRMSSYVIRMPHICARMSFICHSYVLLCQPYVTLVYSYVTRMSLVCTHVSPVCHSYLLVCHPYVTFMYSYVILMSLLCTICHSYVTRAYLYVTRVSLLCTRMSHVCHLYVLYVNRMLHVVWFYHKSFRMQKLKKLSNYLMSKNSCDQEALTFCKSILENMDRASQVKSKASAIKIIFESELFCGNENAKPLKSKSSGGSESSSKPTCSSSISSKASVKSKENLLKLRHDMTKTKLFLEQAEEQGKRILDSIRKRKKLE